MINVQRSARNCTECFPKVGTTEKVGPGTYENKPTLASCAEDNGVPFQSLSEKDLNTNKATSRFTPGPGAYIDQGEFTKGGNGSSSFKSRAKRMAPMTPGSSAFLDSTILLNPGPGTHKVGHSSWMKQSKELPSKASPVLEMTKTAPSIPLQRVRPGQTDERQADPDMSAIKMNFTGQGEDIAGPGEYTLKGEHVLHPEAPSAAGWAASVSQRKLFEPSCAIECKMPSRMNPGPGTYDSRQPSDPESSKEATFQFASKTPMGHQKTLKKDATGPGPGAYRVDQSKGATAKENKQFGSSVERLGWARHSLNQPFTDPYNWGVMGPGHYPEPKSCFATASKENPVVDAVSKTKFRGVHHPSQIMALQEATGPLHAFCSTDIRPCNKKVQQTTPAPGQHNNEESLGFSMKAALKGRAAVGKKGVFGTTADRFHGSFLMTSKDEKPDPTRYDHQECGKQEEAPKSMFQSSIARFKPTQESKEVYATMLGKKETPGPTDYVANMTVNYRSPFRNPRTQHLSFTSGRDRFDAKEIFAGQQYNRNPGPGDYDTLKRSKSLPGAASTRSRRLHEHGSGTMKEVGPGSYNIEGSMLKKTFNVSTESLSGGYRK